MSFFDFNSAEKQQSGELIPAKTKAKVVAKVRPGGHGEGGWLTKSDSGFEYLNLEMTVASEPYARRKVFQVAGVGGTTDGHQKAAEITRSLLRAMLESARDIQPTDESDQARQARQVQGWGDFDGLEFAAEIGVEKDKAGQYPDKNRISKIITPDNSRYKDIMSGTTIVPEEAQKSQTPPQPAPAPAWAGQQQTPPQPAQSQQPQNPVPAWAR